MAPNVRATCPTCGDVEAPIDAVTVVVFTDPEKAKRSTYSTSSYVVECPACNSSFSKPANGFIVSVLLRGGAEIVRCEHPAELCEPHVGDPINEDDVIDFHRAINDSETWAAELTKLTEGPNS